MRQELKEAVAKSCCHVHQQVMMSSATFEVRLRRKVYVTPKSYVDLISLYPAFSSALLPLAAA